MESETELLIWIPVAFVLFFLFIWSSVLYLVSRIAGWHVLARNYPDRQPPEQYAACMASGRVGHSKYGGVLKLHAGSRGLHIAVILPFRPGHPPMCIPWHALRAGEKVGILLAYQQLEVLHSGKTLRTIHITSQHFEALRLAERISDRL